jgi:hypothetical protein
MDPHVDNNFNMYQNPHDDLEYKEIQLMYDFPPACINNDTLMCEANKTHQANIAAFDAL